MREDQNRRRRPPVKPIFGVVINPQAANYSQKEIDRLISRIAKARANWHVIETTVTREASYQIKKLLQRRPVGIIACGGDSTVNLVARNLIRRTCALGILPMGNFNNIYRSLFGEPNLSEARNEIFSGKHLKIDYGVAGAKFFLGSLGIGFAPALLDIIKQKRIPRFAFGWSRLASRAASEVESGKLNLTLDHLKMEITPRIFNVNLLPYSVGLPFTPMSLPDDGCAEVIFDPEAGQAIISGYIRKIFKKKYIYTDEIMMYRGKKIIVEPVAGKNMYLDGEIWELKEPTLEIEIFQGKIRLFKSSGIQE